MIDCCREIGVSVANPHVNNVEGGGRTGGQRATAANYRYDPRGLINPGKMISFVREAPTR